MEAHINVGRRGPQPGFNWKNERREDPEEEGSSFNFVRLIAEVAYTFICDMPILQCS